MWVVSIQHFKEGCLSEDFKMICETVEIATEKAYNHIVDNVVTYKLEYLNQNEQKIIDMIRSGKSIAIEQFISGPDTKYESIHELIIARLNYDINMVLLFK